MILPLKLLVVSQFFNAFLTKAESTGGGVTSIAPPHNSTDNSDLEEEEAKMCENATCVRKCCPEGQYYLMHLEYGCRPLEDNHPKFELSFEFKDGRPTEPDKPVHLLYGSEFPTCSRSAALPEHRKAVLLSDGQLYTAHDTKYRNTSKYCLDVMRRDDVNFGMWPMTCYKKFKETPRTLFRYYGHATCLMLSSVSLLVIIVCHVALPKLRDLSGLCLLSHVSSLFVADVSLVTVNLANKVATDLCIFLGIVIHSSFIATYMWLTVMCFDIWRYVRGRRKPAGIFLLDFGHVMSFEHGIRWQNCPLPLRRRCQDLLFQKDLIFVSRLCSVQQQASRPVLAAIPNILLHIQYFRFWQRFQIFGMTITVWTTEVLSWKIPPKELWDATDLLNTLQGVILLVIFFRSKRKREIMQTKARSFMGKAQTAARQFVSQDETSTTDLETSLSNLNSDQETVDRIRKLSRQEETASSTIMKTLAHHKIEVEPIEETP
ncbi:Methuselah N-terminal domain [Trinorchestia longiramus]|nr:Methuselah N-terminal domain [Trinorchestia longiramus]